MLINSQLLTPVLSFVVCLGTFHQYSLHIHIFTTNVDGAMLLLRKNIPELSLRKVLVLRKWYVFSTVLLLYSLFVSLALNLSVSIDLSILLIHFLLISLLPAGWNLIIRLSLVSLEIILVGLRDSRFVAIMLVVVDWLALFFLLLVP